MTHSTWRQISSRPFLFSPTDETATSPEKYRGLARYGPYAPLRQSHPSIGFVFPEHLVEDARRLFLALRSGIGPFKGCESLLQYALTRDNVFRITGFSVSERSTPAEQARHYSEAILNWHTGAQRKADIFVVLHPRSDSWQEDTPYYSCKAQLLRHGIVSQHVTPELIRNPTQFAWSVADIALQMFVKLGGTPWIMQSSSTRPPELVIGVGRARSARASSTMMGFTACIRADGPFLFSSVAQPVPFGPKYFDRLAVIVARSIERGVKAFGTVQRVVIHMPKEFGHKEAAAVEQGVAAVAQSENAPSIVTLKITRDDDLFACDLSSADGAPPRGLSIRIGERDFLLYTEGREDSRAWQARTPTAMRVRVYGHHSPTMIDQLLQQIYDLAQVNYRGFRATSEPASMKYSKLITRTLSHLETTEAACLHGPGEGALSDRMWFL